MPKKLAMTLIGTAISFASIAILPTTAMATTAQPAAKHAKVKKAPVKTPAPAPKPTFKTRVGQHIGGPNSATIQ